MKTLHVQDIDVDHIWRTLGPFGKYQWKQLISFFFVLISWAIHQLSIVFIGYRPSFTCMTSPINSTTINHTAVQIEYKECEIVRSENTSSGLRKTSAPCEHGWQYDIPRDQSFVTEWDFVCENAELAELTQTLLYIGMMIGNFVFPVLSDRLGRKPVMVLSHVAVFVIALGTSFSGNYYVFVVLRVLTGFATQGGLSGTALVLEMLPTEIRHYQEVLALFVWTSAICLMSPIAFALQNVSWRYIQITYALLSSVSLIQWWMTDESLRWLIANGNIDKAKEIIKKACKWNNKNYNEVLAKVGLSSQHLAEYNLNANGCTDNESVKCASGITESTAFIETKDTLEKSGIAAADVDVQPRLEAAQMEVKQCSVLDIVRNKSILKVSIIMWYIWVCDSLVYYGLYMISGDLYGDRYINFFLSAVIEYPACLFEYCALARLGRKWTCIICHAVAAVALVVATTLTFTAGNSSSMLLVATAFTLLGKMGITGAFSTVYLITPELYPTNMRNSGLGVASSMGKVGAMIAPFSRNISHRTKWLPACIYAAMCAVTVFLLAFVPETNGVELPQTIEELSEWYRVNKFDLKIGKNRHYAENKAQTADISET